MCSIFGTNIRDFEKLKALAIEGEVRGTHATGIASLQEEGYQLSKEDKRATDMDWDKIEEGNFYLGHTRRTTKGTEKNNFNNHPFVSEDKTLLLAHNGVIRNDDELRTYDTKIKTDSFVVMQQLEDVRGDDTLTIEHIKEVAEKLKGSFTLTILDVSTQKLYLLRHTNPLNILFNPSNGDLVYASTTGMIRNVHGNESDLGLFIGETEENLIYEFDLEQRKFVNQLKFQPNIYKTKSKTKSYKSFDYHTSYWDKKKKEFTLSAIPKRYYDKKNDYAYTKYKQCDFCGTWYRDDTYAKAGLTEHNHDFCAYCWEGKANPYGDASTKDIEAAQDKKSKISKADGAYILTESEFNKLDTDEQEQFIFCSECKLYFNEADEVMVYDNDSKTYKCSFCMSRKNQIIEV